MSDDYDGILDKARPTHPYDPDEERDYEIAMDKVNSVVGVYSARLHEVRDDPAAAAPIRAEITRWVEIQKSLRIDDRERVARVRREGEAIIREARGHPAP